jgi:hypothetical protein
MKEKKSIVGNIISVFIVMLVVSILAGLAFLFIAQLKTNVIQSTSTTVSVNNETGWINSTGYTLAGNSSVGFANPVIVGIIWKGETIVIPVANYSLTSSGVLTNGTAANYSIPARINYTYTAVTNLNAYNGVNATEQAGSTVVSYLPLIFLAMIFGAILTLVLKIILPFINLGQSMGSDF